MNYMQSEENDYQHQVHDIDIEADRVIAMNSSGIVETYENENGKKLKCDGDMCVLEDDDVGVMKNDHIESMSNEKAVSSSSSYMTYLLYIVIFLVICAIAYFGYKKFICKE